MEDHGDLLEIMKWILEKEGFEVSIASDGAVAWEFIKANPIALLITDYNMPRMNGAELILQVKSEFPDIPIILSSSYLPSDIDLNDKIKYYVVKPYDVEKLIKLIHLILKPS